MSDNGTNGASGASAGNGQDAGSSANPNRPEDIPIEVETSPTPSTSPGQASPGQASTAANQGDRSLQKGPDDEIAIEVDTRESEAAERIARLEADKARLEADKAQLEKERQEHWERVLRTTADFDNFRKRARRDIDDARLDAHTKVLRPMLEVIDNLERAVAHAESVDDPIKAHAAVLDGVKLVLRQFVQVLDRFEVKPVDAFGRPFDPTQHEAISQVETADHPSGSVVQVPQKGYTIGERLLRPALVVVAKAPPASEATPDTNHDSAPDTDKSNGQSADHDPATDSAGQPGDDKPASHDHDTSEA